MKSYQKEKIAVVLFNLGGPDSLGAVPSFLFNIFNDSYIINLPNPFRFLLAKIISFGRSKKARKIYSLLGGKSPLLDNTFKQAKVLQFLLDQNEGKNHFKVFVAMRYWHPFFSAVLPDILSFSPSRIIFLPLYPQFSSTTTLSFYTHAKKLLNKEKCSLPTQLVCCYPMFPGFIEALVQSIQQVRDFLFSNPNKIRLLLTAHGLPISIVKKGDPYPFQLDLTKKAIENNLKGIPFESIVLCYQSKVGVLPWLSPSVEEELRRTANDKVSVVLLPISFVSEHSETLVELDIEYSNLAYSLGIAFYHRLPTVSCAQPYIEGLYKVVLESINSSKKVLSSENARICPIESTFCPCSFRE